MHHDMCGPYKQSDLEKHENSLTWAKSSVMGQSNTKRSYAALSNTVAHVKFFLDF